MKTQIPDYRLSVNSHDTRSTSLLAGFYQFLALPLLDSTMGPKNIIIFLHIWLVWTVCVDVVGMWDLTVDAVS